ncbi:glycoside hydrolase family 53 protein [Cadophora sp. DSE1049]|nr:glycoside hydrolase family 53 protein [Cadophora sp. DSE1049]
MFLSSISGKDNITVNNELVTKAAARLEWRAADWSSTIVQEREGIKYKNAQGVVKSLEQILVESGINMGLSYNLQLARRAWNAGLQFGLNLHYSETWTNPCLQTPPSTWPTDITGLTQYVYTYTLSICNEFAAEGLIPRTITIGNEINSGMLSPLGKYDQPYNLALILKFECNQGMTFSHYPFWGSFATVANFETSLTNLINAYKKPVMVVETNWPTSCSKPEYTFPTDTVDIPLSVAGQAIWMQRLAAALASLPGGLGLSYWEPAWINNAVLGSSCEWNTLFDASGKAYSSMNVFNSF